MNEINKQFQARKTEANKQDVSACTWWRCDYCSFHISLSKAFWRSFFYSLLFLAVTFTMCVNVFLYNQEQNFSLIRRKTKYFPIDPHYKNRPLLLRHVYRHDVTKVGYIYNGGLWGNFSFLSDPTEILFLVI